VRHPGGAQNAGSVAPFLLTSTKSSRLADATGYDSVAIEHDRVEHTAKRCCPIRVIELFVEIPKRCGQLQGPGDGFSETLDADRRSVRYFLNSHLLRSDFRIFDL